MLRSALQSLIMSSADRDRRFRLESQYRRKLYLVQDILMLTAEGPSRRSHQSATDCDEVFPGIILGNG